MATLLPQSSEPVLQTVSVRVVGSHCPEREAVTLLREACVMTQLCHRNVAMVLGMVLSQCPVILQMFLLFACVVHNMMLDLALRRVAHTLTLVTTQCDARIDSDFILALHTCIWSQKIWLIFACHKLDATQCKV